METFLPCRETAERNSRRRAVWISQQRAGNHSGSQRQSAIGFIWIVHLFELSRTSSSSNGEPDLTTQSLSIVHENGAEWPVTKNSRNCLSKILSLIEKIWTEIGIAFSPSSRAIIGAPWDMVFISLILMNTRIMISGYAPLVSIRRVATPARLCKEIEPSLIVNHPLSSILKRAPDFIPKKLLPFE